MNGSYPWRERLNRLGRSLFEQRWLNLGLRAKMGLLVEVGLIGLMAIFLFLGVSTARDTTQRILKERVMVARLSAASVDSSIRYIRSTLEITASAAAFLDPSHAQTDRFTGLDTAYNRLAPIVQGIYWLDVSGDEIYAAVENDLVLDWGILQGRSNVQNSVVYQQGSGDPLAMVLYPVTDEAGQITGWLAAVLDFRSSRLAPFQSAGDLGASSILDLVNADGQVLVSSDPDQAAPPSTIESVKELFVAGEPVVETCLGCAGVENPEASDEVIAFAPLAEAPLGVVVRQSASELMAPVNRLLIQTLILGLITVVGALALVWITTNSVIRPVQKLTEAVNRIASGDLSTPMEVIFSDWFIVRRLRQDEIGALARNFETMRRQLKRSIDETQELNRELDRRVQERTQDARAAQLQAQDVRDDLRAIIDALDDGLIVLNVDDHRVELANRAALAEFNHTRTHTGMLCSQNCPQLAPCPAETEDCLVQKVVKDGDSARTICESETSPGNLVYREITASPLRDREGKITRVVELTHDVTEEKRNKESLVLRNRQLSILNALATTVNQSLKLEEIIDRSLDAVLRLTKVDMGAVYLFEALQGALKLMAYRGMSPEAAQIAANMGLLDSSCGGVVEHGRVVIVPGIAHYRGVRARSLQREGIDTLVHIPLTSKGCVLGSMCVGARCEREFSQEDQDLLQAIGSQIAVAIENAQLYAEVQQKEHMRGELFKKAINAQEDERKRIARELHDETSQSLTALLFAMEEAVEMKSLSASRKRLADMHDLTRNTLDGVHKLIFDLRPSVLDHLGLVPAIRWLGKERLEPRGIRFVVDGELPDHRLPPELESALFRVVQEAVSNIARHSAARNVDISVRCDHDQVEIRVEDDGVGFNPTELELNPDSPRGLGLIGMQERLELLGGEMQLASGPGSGTQIHLTVPVKNGASHGG